MIQRQTDSVNEHPASWMDVGIHTYIKTAVIASLFISLFNVEIYGIVHRWISDSSWSHGFLIPFFSLYFLNQKKKELLTTQFRPNYLGLLFLVLCLIGYPLIIYRITFGYLKTLIIIPTIGSVILLMGGWKLVRYTWLPTLYLVFAMPLPARLYREITIPMREVAAAVATALLNLVDGIQATASGVVIDVVYKGVRLEPALDVAEACSGMRLLMAFLALGVAMAYLHYRPVWQRMILLCSTIPIAVLSNVIRVTITGFIYILWEPKYAQGIYHDMLGMAMLPLAFVLYGFLAWFMGNLFEDEHTASEDDIIVRKTD